MSKLRTAADAVVRIHLDVRSKVAARRAINSLDIKGLIAAEARKWGKCGAPFVLDTSGVPVRGEGRSDANIRAVDRR